MKDNEPKSKPQDPIAIIEAGDAELLENYLREKFAEQSDQGKISKTTLLMQETKFKCRDFDALVFVLLVAAIHYRKDNLVPILLDHSKGIKLHKIEILLFGILSITKNFPQESLNNIFQKIVEKFVGKFTDDYLFNLLIYAIHYELVDMVGILCGINRIANNENILDRLDQRDDVRARCFQIDLSTYLFDANFLKLLFSEVTLNPLRMATVRNDVEMVELLLNAGAHNLPTAHTSFGVVEDAFTAASKAYCDEIVALFLNQGICVFQSLDKKYLKILLAQENVHKALLVGCTLITESDTSLAISEFKHPKVIATIEQFKQIPINSKNVELFKRWYNSICYAQNHIDQYTDDVKVFRKQWNEAEQWKFEILQLISRRSPQASLETQCLFVLKQGFFKEKNMRKLNLLPTEILEKFVKFPLANFEAAQHQFFRLVWKDYVANCGNENICKLDAYLEKLFQGRDKYENDVQNYIDEIYKFYRKELQDPIFAEIIANRLRSGLLANIKKPDRNQLLFSQTLAIVKIAVPGNFDKLNESEKDTWINENNLFKLLGKAENYIFLYSLAREFDMVDFRDIQIGYLAHNFFVDAFRKKSTVLEDLVGFFNEKVNGAVTVNKIKADLQILKNNFGDFYVSNMLQANYS